jgi:glyoxylase-like metal-dependent hydrolase (beta-lactamase superfamily II)
MLIHLPDRSPSPGWIPGLALIFAMATTSATAAPSAGESPVDKINAEAARASITVQPLRGDLTVLMGSGGNITVLNSAEGKLMVDAGIALSRRGLEPALNGISPKPIKYVINTHWHWDHADGNEWVHAVSGAKIVAHGKSLEHLSTTLRIDDWNHTFAPVPESARPTMIVNSRTTLGFGDESVLISSYEPSHTDGDLYVYFTKADVLATGDTWWNGNYPFIDYVGGGGIDGMIEVTKENIARTTDHTLIVPGHGPVGDRRQLIEYREMLVAIRDNVANLKKQGKSLGEVIAAKPTAAYDDRWGRAVIGPTLFTSLVYRGI